jgi:peptidyl-prolyl cis-trans isomerase C
MTVRAPIKINGVLLPPHVIATEAQHHPSQTPAAAFQAAARALVVRALLLEEADRAAIAAAPQFVAPGKRELDDEARIRTLMQARVPIVEPDRSECLAEYEAGPSRFRSPDLYEASHILFLAHPHDIQAYTEAAARAQVIIADLSDAPARFETIAREQSQCESRANGGRLGQMSEGTAVPEFEKALQGLEEGQIAPAPIKSRFGAHVLRLDARARGEILPFEYVCEQIASYLAEKRWRRDVAAYIEQIVERADIEGVDMLAQSKGHAT